MQASENCRADNQKGTIAATPASHQNNMELCLSRGPCRTLVCDKAEASQLEGVAKVVDYGVLNN